MLYQLSYANGVSSAANVHPTHLRADLCSSRRPSDGEHARALDQSTERHGRRFGSVPQRTAGIRRPWIKIDPGSPPPSFSGSRNFRGDARGAWLTVRSQEPETKTNQPYAPRDDGCADLALSPGRVKHESYRALHAKTRANSALWIREAPGSPPGRGPGPRPPKCPAEPSTSLGSDRARGSAAPRRGEAPPPVAARSRARRPPSIHLLGSLRALFDVFQRRLDVRTGHGERVDQRLLAPFCL